MTERQLIEPIADVLDSRVLRELLVLVGPEGPALLRSIGETYARDLPTIVESIGDAMAHNDPTSVRLLVHRLKSSCMSIGAHRLAARCADIEAQCLAGMMPSPTDYAAIVDDFTATTNALRILLNELL